MSGHKMVYVGKDKKMTLEQCHFCQNLNLMDCRSCLLNIPQTAENCNKYQAIAQAQVAKRMQYLLQHIGFPIECNQQTALFKKLKDILGCEYLSDIRNKYTLNTAKNSVAELELSPYSAFELADLAEYLYGVNLYRANKSVIINFLKKKGKVPI